MCCLQELADEAEVVAKLPEIVLSGQENQTETQVLVDYDDVSVRLGGVGLAAHNNCRHTSTSRPQSQLQPGLTAQYAV